MTADLKSLAWKTLAGSYYYSGLPQLRHRGRVAILTYHRVVTEEMVRAHHIQPGMYVLARTFEAHVAYLRERFSILPLQQLVDLWQTGRLEEGRAYCAVTFDDGWRDNYQYAFPVLKKHGVPATIFLATDYIGTPFWFWPDQLAFIVGEARARMSGDAVHGAIRVVLRDMSEIGGTNRQELLTMLESKEPIDTDAFIEWCKRLGPEPAVRFVVRLGRELVVEIPKKRVLLDWDEVREMASGGIAFGSHSCTHRIMTQLPEAEAAHELGESWRVMLQEGIKPVPIFCYPNGDCHQSLKRLVREKGYVAALGCGIGLECDRPADPFELKRIGLHQDRASSLPLLALTLSGFR